MIEKLEKSIKFAEKIRASCIWSAAIYFVVFLVVYYCMPGREPASGHDVIQFGFCILLSCVNFAGLVANEVKLENYKNLLEICKQIQTNSVAKDDKQ